MNNSEFKHNLKILGDNVKKIRIEKGLTLGDLALSSGLRRVYLAKIESGQAVRLDLKHMQRLCVGLDISVKELYATTPAHAQPNTSLRGTN